MTKKRYTHLFFDLDNTLWDFEKNSRFALKQAFEYFKLQSQGTGFAPFYEAYTTHNHQLWEMYRRGNLTKKELINQRFSLTFNTLGMEGVDPETMNTYYLDVMPEHKAMVDGAVDLLEFIKKRRIPMFIITNGFREVQHKKLEATGLKNYFHKIFISEEIKAPKPSHEIFSYALTSANARKESSLMIGDDLEVDVVGAIRFGIDAVWYNPKGDSVPSSAFTTGHKEKLIHCAYTLEELKILI